jgi:hypothetical protein
MTLRKVSILFYGLMAAGLAGWAVWPILSLRRGPAPLNRSPYLADVVEPITIVEGMSFDDGGSQGLRFKDARGVVKDVCLEDTRIWEDNPRILEGHHNIIMNSFFPRGDKARRVPISGVEERALLGLLDRWSRKDPDAQILESRFERYRQGEIRIEAFWEGLSPDARVKTTAVSILRTLRARN